jgi:hypothetical protein
MALRNFIKTVWSANILEALRKAQVFASVANSDYQGELKNLGDKVRIMQIGPVTITAYTKDSDITIQDLDDSASELAVDQPYYFGFKVNDIEAVQVKPTVLAQATGNAAYGFRDKVDSYFAGLVNAGAGIHSYATGTTPWDVTSLNVEDVLLDVKEKMARVPQQGRFIICPEWFHNKLILAGLAARLDNNAIFDNGNIGRVMGFEILLSENVSATSTTTWDHTKILAGVRGQSLSFVDSINQIEAFRPEKRFEDAVKGLYIFGGKVMRPDMTVCIHADKTAEA